MVEDRLKVSFEEALKEARSVKKWKGEAFVDAWTRGIVYRGETPEGDSVVVTRLIYNDNWPHTGYGFKLGVTSMTYSVFGHNTRNRRMSAIEKKAIKEIFDRIDAKEVNYRQTLVSNGGLIDIRILPLREL